MPAPSQPHEPPPSDGSSRFSEAAADRQLLKLVRALARQAAAELFADARATLNQEPADAPHSAADHHP
jgi:hypothetical protein